MKYCAMCGTQMEDDWAACPKCGTMTAKDQVSATAAATTVAAAQTPSAPAATPVPGSAPPDAVTMTSLEAPEVPVAPAPMLSASQKKKSKAPLIVLVVVLILGVLAAAGFAVYMFFFADDAKDDGSSDHTAATTTTADTTTTTTGPNGDGDAVQQNSEAGNEAAIAQRFVGTWRAEIDYTDLFNQMIPQAIGMPVEFDSVEIPICFRFHSDGTLEMALISEDIRKMYEELLPGMIESLLEGQGYYYTFDEYAAMTGITLDMLVDEAMKGAGMPEDGEKILATYEWGIKGEEFYMIKSGSKITEDAYTPYIFDEYAGTLLLLTPPMMDDIDTDDEMVRMLLDMFPMTLTKVSDSTAGDDNGDYPPLTGDDVQTA